MASERDQRQIDRILDEAEEAITNQDWNAVGDRARSVLRLETGGWSGPYNPWGTNSSQR